MITKWLVFDISKFVLLHFCLVHTVLCRTSLCEKYPYSEFLWSLFTRIRTEYRQILFISPFLVQMWENTDQKNSKYGRFSRSVFLNLEQSLFTTSETELDYYHYRVSVRVAEGLTFRILGNLEISRKSLKCSEVTASAQLATRIESFDNCTKKLQKITFKTFHGKTYFVYFENLSTMFCPRFLL